MPFRFYIITFVRLDVDLQSILGMAKEAGSCSKDLGRIERITIANHLNAALYTKFGEHHRCCK